MIKTSNTPPKYHEAGCCNSVCWFCHLKYQSYHYSDYQDSESTYDCYFEECIIPGYESKPPRKSYRANEEVRLKNERAWKRLSKSKKDDHIALILARISTGDEFMNMRDFKMARNPVADLTPVDDCIEELEAELARYEKEKRDAKKRYEENIEAIKNKYDKEHTDDFGGFFLDWLEKKMIERNVQLFSIYGY